MSSGIGVKRKVNGHFCPKHLSGDYSVFRLSLYHTIMTFNDPEKEAFFENIVGKGENAGNQHFLLFPQCFLVFPEQNLLHKSNLLCRLQSLSNWTGPKFCCLVKN